MSDMGDTFRAMKEHKVEKRASNTIQGKKALIQHGIIFKECNGGAHIVIDEYNTGIIDYWPSTGLWIPRNTKLKKRGIFALLKYIGKGVINE